MDRTRELAFLRFLSEKSSHLDEVREADKALKLALRIAREVFEADEACIATVPPGSPRAEPAICSPQGALWDGALLADFLRGRRPRVPRDTVCAPIERRRRPWAVLALRRRRGEYDRGAVREATRVAEEISRLVRRIDRERVAEVRARIDRKVMEQLRPKDLFYQILHGLRSLTRYDHSAAVLIHDGSGRGLELVAEQVAWRKGKSRRIGEVLALGAEARAAVEGGEVLGFDRVQGRWREWGGRGGEALAEALDFDRAGGEGDRRELCMLCAPLSSRDGALGLVKVANCHPATLGAWEADLVRRFLPQAAVAIRTLERAESLETGMLRAEKKHFLANLARGVSHDVNNAFGSVLPLVQQMIVDARAGRVDRETLVADLEQIECSLQVCRRIFGGMLSFAKEGGRNLGEGDVRRAVESTLAILQDGMRSNGIQVRVELPERLPLVRGSQSDLEQLLLNIASNGKDAMSGGGELALVARADGDRVELVVSDTGAGIPHEHMARIQEPFFTTKMDGNGLGLSICRSIVWNMRGRLAIESQPGEGTRVRVLLPTAVGGEGEP